ncbi:phosphatase domain-containing protein [uncultured Sulfitobacter sp.]|uniref:phosphatase domain-containing protein n=1 Tax=uncultured Sulfitobacter sp. TaxID=191468 RepID=UPI0026048830|nr:phosphatase domain-containing protein [uncultured Sulfitobacter sp.]
MVILRGRVLATPRRISEPGNQSQWRNFVDFVRLFCTDELSELHVTTADGNAQTVTDEEGFFTLAWPVGDAPPPHQVAVQLEGSDEEHMIPVYSSVDAVGGVISDIDDTLLLTGAHSLVRNLWTSATGNVHQRKIFDDAAELLQKFDEQDTSFFFVSSSPWNLFQYLQSIFVRTGLPLGPFFLRDLGVSETKFITGTHGDHKTAAINTVLDANPHLKFTLIGDTGQHDPHIYRAAVEQSPSRFDRVVLRRPTDADLPKSVADDISRIKAKGVPVSVGHDFRDLLAELET